MASVSEPKKFFSFLGG